MPRSEDRLAARLRRSDSAASADHLPPLQRRGGAGTLSIERGEKMGSLGEGEREGRGWSSMRRAPRAGRWTSSFPSQSSGTPAASPGDVRDRQSAAMCGAEAGEEFDLRLARRALGASRATPRRGLLSWGMLGGGNRGRGVGDEPSRSLRGSGVVARLLRLELSAEHLSLSRLGPGSRDTAHPSRTTRSRGTPAERAPSARALRPAVEPRAGLARL